MIEVLEIFAVGFVIGMVLQIPITYTYIITRRWL